MVGVSLIPDAPAIIYNGSSAMVMLGMRTPQGPLS